jgi:hypothetical protein
VRNGGREGKWVIYEPVFTSKLAPAKEWFALHCRAEFCAPLPKALEKALIASLSSG